MFQGRSGFLNLLKDGGRMYSGLEEATHRNIDACKTLASITRTSMGPNCMNKLISSHIEKLFVTSDGATLLEQMEVQHPAAKVLAMAAKMQDQEYGDGTNFVLILGGELLLQAQQLLLEGLHVNDVLRGFELAAQEAERVLNENVCFITTGRDENSLRHVIASATCSKSISCTDLIADLVLKATMQVTAGSSSAMDNNNINNSDTINGDIKTEAGPGVKKSNNKSAAAAAAFNTDNVRIAKLLSGSPTQSKLIQGMVVLRDSNGCVKSKENVKVIVLGCGLEFASTEAKGTVLLHSADELLNFSSGEEKRMDAIIKSIADAKIEAIIVGGNISDLAQHFCDKYGILTLKVQSKYELLRLSRTLRAGVVLKLAVPSPEEIGFASSITVQEISSKTVTLIRSIDSKVSTILLRGATNGLLDEMERVAQDGICAIRNAQRDGRFVPGAGAAEIEIAYQLSQSGKKITGLEQYAYLKFAEAFEVVPRTLCENCGLFPMQVTSELHSAHGKGQKTFGVDVLGDGTSARSITPEASVPTTAAAGTAATTAAAATSGKAAASTTINGSGAGMVDAQAVGIIDNLMTKLNAIRLAVDAATTVLRVDQIIMSRPAGGPKPPEQSGRWDED